MHDEVLFCSFVLIKPYTEINHRKFKNYAYILKKINFTTSQMNELETIRELLLDREKNQQKWNLEQDHKNKELSRVN